MSDHTYDMILSDAMLREFYMLEKQAATAWTGRLVGAGIGALGGGLAGRYTAPEEQKNLGTVRGAILGGIGGLGAGQFATKAGRTEALQFGQRQLHGATGYMPGRGLFGRGAEGKQLTGSDRIKALEDMGFKFGKGKDMKSALKESEKEVAEGVISGIMPKGVQKFWAKRHAAAELARRQVAEAGMTSLPGLAKGYVGRGLPVAGKVMTPWQAAKTNLKAPGIAMGVGVPALMSAQSLAEYGQTGDTGQLAGSLAGNVALGAGGALPITAAMGLGSAVGRAGTLVARGATRARDALVNRPVAQPVEQPVGQVAPR